MANTLFLTELEHTLQYWEDVNLFCEVMFQFSNEISLSSAFKHALSSGYTKPLVGSEVDEMFNLKRAIKNYKAFRQMIEGNVSIDDPTLFLPRVPKEYRDRHDSKESMLLMQLVYGISCFPLPLSLWLGYKKVFAIESLDSIKSVSVYEKNYLTQLPYQSFVLRLNQPISIFFQKTKAERMFTTIVCSTLGEYLHVFLIREDVATYVMDTNDRKTYESFLHMHKSPGAVLRQLKKFTLSDFDPWRRFGGFAIEIATGNKAAGSIPVMDQGRLTAAYDFSSEDIQLVSKFNGEVSSEIFPAEQGSEEYDIFMFEKYVITAINGFCKFVSELPSREAQLQLNGPVKESIPHFDFTKWNVIPVTNVINLDKEVQDGIRITMPQGGEKSPHWRRKHERVYRNPDGSVRKKIWVEETLIRPDKLEEENLKGNVTVLKKEKINLQGSHF